MSYLWTSNDTRYAVISSLLPASVGAIGCYSLPQDRDVASFVKKFRPPSWAIRSQAAYAAVDFAVLSPLGYASYLVFKEGGGFDYTDTSVALSVYGLNLAGLAALIPAFKKKSLKSVAGICVFNAVTAAGAAYAFSKISKRAGYWLIPYVLWSGYYSAVAVKVYQNSANEPTPIMELSENTV